MYMPFPYCLLFGKYQEADILSNCNAIYSCENMALNYCTAN